jgi:hypothetical protein
VSKTITPEEVKEQVARSVLQLQTGSVPDLESDVAAAVVRLDHEKGRRAVAVDKSALVKDVRSAPKIIVIHPLPEDVERLQHMGEPVQGSGKNDVAPKQDQVHAAPTPQREKH